MSHIAERTSITRFIQRFDQAASLLDRSLYQACCTH